MSARSTAPPRHAAIAPTRVPTAPASTDADHADERARGGPRASCARRGRDRSDRCRAGAARRRRRARAAGSRRRASTSPMRERIARRQHRHDDDAERERDERSSARRPTRDARVAASRHAAPRVDQRQQRVGGEVGDDHDARRRRTRRARARRDSRAPTIAVSISRPIPGHAKTLSTNTEPATMPGSDSANEHDERWRSVGEHVPAVHDALGAAPSRARCARSPAPMHVGDARARVARDARRADRGEQRDRQDRVAERGPRAARQSGELGAAGSRMPNAGSRSHAGKPQRATRRR